MCLDRTSTASDTGCNLVDSTEVEMSVFFSSLACRCPPWSSVTSQPTRTVFSSQISVFRSVFFELGDGSN